MYYYSVVDSAKITQYKLSKIRFLFSLLLSSEIYLLVAVIVSKHTHTHFLYNYPTHHTHTKTDQPIISQHMTGYHPLINRKLALGFSHD